MTGWRSHPLVYEIPAWPWLRERQEEAGRALTLAEVPERDLERLAAGGFDAVWLMGVWERSPGARHVAREHPGLLEAYRRALPDVTPADVVGSPYAVHRYQVAPELGGDDACAELRRRLARRGLRLVLDFVPNHLALDHAWVWEHPERLVQGTAADLEREPWSYFRAGDTPHVFAHGRDPHFDGWTDTVQLDYRRKETRDAMAELLADVARRCDGVRCDMAMLVLRDVFLRNWGGTWEPPDAEHWPEAIARARAANPEVMLLAEVYWSLEARLQEVGFDFTYDKALYDLLRRGDAPAVRSHLHADLDAQRRLARFVENHDEERAVTAFGVEGSRAAATAALTLPGLRLLHDGQLDGWEGRLPVQLGRRLAEPTRPEVREHYDRLLAALAEPIFHDGQWELVDPREAWPGNPSHDAFVAHLWTGGEARRLVAVNLAAHRSQCALPLDLPPTAAGSWRLQDLLGPDVFVRADAELGSPGLFLDLPPHGAHLFAVTPMAPVTPEEELPSPDLP